MKKKKKPTNPVIHVIIQVGGERAWRNGGTTSLGRCRVPTIVGDLVIDTEVALCVHKKGVYEFMT